MKMTPRFIDTETLGFCGPITLIQHCKGVDGEIELFEPWLNPVESTLLLIDNLMEDPEGIVGFNLAFDHFQLCKLYTIFSILKDKYGADYIPNDFSI